MRGIELVDGYGLSCGHSLEPPSGTVFLSSQRTQVPTDLVDVEVTGIKKRVSDLRVSITIRVLQREGERTGIIGGEAIGIVQASSETRPSRMRVYRPVSDHVFRPTQKVVKDSVNLVRIIEGRLLTIYLVVVDDDGTEVGQVIGDRS